MPEEIIFDENIKGKVQVESLSELEDYVEHENVKRNATITKITRTIGKIIILFTEFKRKRRPFRVGFIILDF